MQRVRVNSPDTLTGPFKDRVEAKAPGFLKIDLPLDPATLASTELYLELWGGHPGTGSKSFTLNGRGNYPLPEVGAADQNCVYHYPATPLKLSDLLRGQNTFQFTCDRHKTFWGHFIIDNTAIRATLPPDHAELKQLNLMGFVATVSASPAAEDERLDLSLACPPEMLARIASVDYEGFYTGYDENGDGVSRDWHGFTKGKRPQAILGSSAQAPFRLSWNTAMLPDQKDIAIRAIIYFKDAPNLSYRTAQTTPIPLPRRSGSSVSLSYSKDFPKPFWSRASKRQACTIHLDADPAQIEAAELHVAIWDGGRGNTSNPFTLNGHPLPVAGAGKHDLLYRIIPLDPALLAKGQNEIVVLSDTEHHGIEVLLPGPALVVRHKKTAP